MIALVPLLLLGGIVFVEQPIDGLAVYNLDYWNAQHFRRSWRCADLDGDGANDILTPERVAFQRDGQFPKTQQTPFPSLGNRPIADVWGNEVFVLLGDRIEVQRWSHGDWQRTLSQPIVWTNPVLPYPADGVDGPRQQLFFDRFLHDIDGDGKPEIVRVSTDGLRVYAKGELFYEEKALWPVRPVMRPIVAAQRIWPANVRVVEPPLLLGTANYVIDDHTLTVLSSTSYGSTHFSVNGKLEPYGWANRGNKQFREVRYAIASDDTYSLSEEAVSMQESALLLDNWETACLNDDNTIDVVRVRYVGETSPPYSVSIFEVAASTDAGHTIYTVQCTGSRPRQILIDFNHDGRMDIVTESKLLAEGGIRETLVRGFTRREVDLDVELRLQDAQGGFPAKPSIRHHFSVSLDKPPANLSKMFWNFVDGGFLQLCGDVDGDGTNDAVIHDRPDKLTVFKGNADGISANKLGVLPIQPTGLFYIFDVDEDGRDDVLVTRPGAGDQADASATVYLSRENKP